MILLSHVPFLALQKLIVLVFEIHAQSAFITGYTVLQKFRVSTVTATHTLIQSVTVYTLHAVTALHASFTSAAVPTVLTLFAVTAALTVYTVGAFNQCQRQKSCLFLSVLVRIPPISVYVFPVGFCMPLMCITDNAFYNDGHGTSFVQFKVRVS